jgi:hypothetical protein
LARAYLGKAVSITPIDIEYFYREVEKGRVLLVAKYIPHRHVLASKCFRIDKEAFDKVLERKTADGVIFFRRLAGILGERPINIYDTLLLG